MRHRQQAIDLRQMPAKAFGEVGSADRTRAHDLVESHFGLDEFGDGDAVFRDGGRRQRNITSIRFRRFLVPPFLGLLRSALVRSRAACLIVAHLAEMLAVPAVAAVDRERHARILP